MHKFLPANSNVCRLARENTVRLCFSIIAVLVMEDMMVRTEHNTNEVLEFKHTV